MRKSCLAIVVVLIICLLQKGRFSREFSNSGNLSEISEEVIAIPLQTTNECKIEKIRNIQKEGNDLFLISNETLYRFDKRGNFICKVTDPKIIKVAGYVVNPINHQIIVLGNTDDIHYYSYNGHLLESKKLTSEFSNQQISSISMYKNHIWTTENAVKYDTTGQTCYIEKQAVEYDTSFRKINSYKLETANIGREQICPSIFHPLLSISEDTGRIYAYSPSIQPKQLLKDTLSILSNFPHILYTSSNNNIPVFPIRFGERFCISTYYNSVDQMQNYTFCFDRKKNKAWQVNGGFKDNFYDTGNVELQAMDMFNKTYYFCKSGKAVQKSFPNRESCENPILFIVKLKV